MAPAYKRPVAPIPVSWNYSINQEGLAVDNLEWKAFIVDPALRKMIESALTNNRSLQQTLLDIQQAREQYRIKRADRLPDVNGSAVGDRQRLPSEVSNNGREGIISSYQVGLSLPEYEVDLFGRIKSLSEAALEQYLASEEVGNAARIALISEVSQTYLAFNSAELRQALTRRTLANREDSLAIIGQQRVLGTATALDHQEALGLVELSRAQLEEITREQRRAFNALVLLLGTPDAATSLSTVGSREPLIFNDIAPGAPSALIERRPDILAAEHRLRARNADIGAARAAFFPRISLTGSYGTTSNQMSGLFDGGSRSWSFVPKLSLPILDGGRNRAQLSVAETRKDSAVAAYELTIQVAFYEVADALAATDTLRRELTARRALVDTSHATLALAKARYEGGIDTHLRYMEAQRSNYANEAALIEVSTQRQLALVNLFRALGGGWTTSM